MIITQIGMRISATTIISTTRSNGGAAAFRSIIRCGGLGRKPSGTPERTHPTIPSRADERLAIWRNRSAAPPASHGFVAPTTQWMASLRLIKPITASLNPSQLEGKKSTQYDLMLAKKTNKTTTDEIQ